VNRGRALPCRSDPDRRFDRADRAPALLGCLSCPVRRDCAATALRARADWGIWAGIWIDGDHAVTAEHLRAIAAGASAAPTRRCTPPPRPAIPRRRLPGVAAARSRSMLAAVTARSCGYCEVMADGCRYTARTLISRVLGIDGHRGSPAAAFYACAGCADVIADADPGVLRRDGYLVDGADQVDRIPFRWRRSRWVLLEHDGRLAELPELPALSHFTAVK
jgi:hypothetical protein